MDCATRMHYHGRPTKDIQYLAIRANMEASGTDLGLALVKTLVDHWWSTIQVISEAEQTTFIVI